MCRQLHQGASRRLAQRRPTGAVGEHAQRVRLSADRFTAGAGDRHLVGHEGVGADLDRRSRRLRRACAAVSRTSSIGPGFAAIATARTQRAGKAILTICCRPRARYGEFKHHAAMPYAEVPAFMAALREQDGIGARAFEFLILTAARTGEVIGLRWHEIDLKKRLWTVPADRMKAGNEHRVPLCSRAIAILQAIKPNQIDGDAYVFPGSKPQKPQSNMVFLMLLRRMKLGHLTAHGFRATFKTWATERTNFPREVVEAALAHVAGDKLEAAYQRGDIFDKRLRLMTAWADYCGTKPATAINVVSMRSTRHG